MSEWDAKQKGGEIGDGLVSAVIADAGGPWAATSLLVLPGVALELSQVSF